MTHRVIGPEFGITRMPTGERASHYPDLEVEKLVGTIEAEGARLAWSRAAECPCAPVDTQLKQPDPNCTVCRGTGLVYFGPQDYVAPAEAGELDAIQEAILADSGAAVIRGVVARVVAQQNMFDVYGRWMWGAMMVTVRPENKIGYMDRLVSLDSEICYPETVLCVEGSTTIPLRYRVTGVNLLRTLTEVLLEGTDFDLIDGRVVWKAARVPNEDTYVSGHYLMHPTWIIIDHPHIVREISRRKRGVRQNTPFGTPSPLPIQAHVRLEYLPFPENP